MQISREVTDSLTIHSYEPGQIQVGERRLREHLIISRVTIVAPWEIDTPEAISAATLDQALALEPEILLIGTGQRFVMADVALIGELARRGVGVEFMDTAAACRTFNVLAHEQRAVVAALYNA